MRLWQRSVFLLAVAVAGLLFASAPRVAGHESTTRHAIEVEIVPDLERADAYLARVEFTDLETGRILGRPQVRFLRGPGGKGHLRSGTPDGLEVGVVVEVDEAGETATYQAEVWRGEELLSAHRARIRLAGREPAE